jgi:hypothetical protein
MAMTYPQTTTHIKQEVKNYALIAMGKINGISSPHYYLCQQINKKLTKEMITVRLSIKGILK